MSWSMIRTGCLLLCIGCLTWLSAAPPAEAASLPSACRPVRSYYNQSRATYRIAIRSVRMFKRTTKLAFRSYDITKRSFNVSKRKYTSSKRLYSNLRRYLSSKGINLSRGRSWSNWKKRFKLGKGLGFLGKPSKKPKKKVDTKRVKTTKRKLRTTQTSIRRTISLNRISTRTLRYAKTLAVRSKSRIAAARAKIQRTLRQIRACRNALRQRKPLRRRTQRVSDSPYRRCAKATQDEENLVCRICDAGDEYCHATCLQSLPLNSMEQQSQQQMSELDNQEKQSGLNGNIMFEIDMRLGNDQQTAQQSQQQGTETDSALGALR